MFGGGRDQNSYLLKATVKYDFGNHIDVVESNGISFSEIPTFNLIQNATLTISSTKFNYLTYNIDNTSIAVKVGLVRVSM